MDGRIIWTNAYESNVLVNGKKQINDEDDDVDKEEEGEGEKEKQESMCKMKKEAYASSVVLSWKKIGSLSIRADQFTWISDCQCAQLNANIHILAVANHRDDDASDANLLLPIWTSRTSELTLTWSRENKVMASDLSRTISALGYRWT